MDRVLAAMCRRFLRQSLVITRNQESRNVLAELGVPVELGTDTGWTFEPHPQEYAHKVLREAGWDERTPILVLCPINPFFWPVRPSLAKYALHGLTGAYAKSHYRTVYFHNAGPAVDAAYERYLTAWAGAVNAFRTQHTVFPILVGTERLDADACRRLAERLGGVPVFTSEQYDMYQLVSLLRAARLMVSSRYHAIVTSMPALVPSAGVTMDERIRNLMRERGHTDLLTTVDDPELESKILAMLGKLMQEGEGIAGGIGRTVVRNLKLMARMGVRFEEHVLERYPEFPARRGPLSWEDYLPPLSPGLRKLVEAHGG
jgi:polysaccharide pyruvyl transferase WcaK-like protein